jgi:hypothetical protein
MQSDSFWRYHTVWFIQHISIFSSSLLARKREVAKNAVYGRSGKPLTTKEIDALEEQERKKEQEVCQARLENIRQKHRLKKRELALKQKEELAAGLHLIDFEQLKIENQTYNEKIEERNEDLQKLKRKIESTVQVILPCSSWGNDPPQKCVGV